MQKIRIPEINRNAGIKYMPHKESLISGRKPHNMSTTYGSTIISDSSRGQVHHHHTDLRI